MIPQTPQQIRAWLDRLNISHALAAEALGLGNANKVMREYCSPVHPREPAYTTRMHMDLLEVTRDATALLQRGDHSAALAKLMQALDYRGLIDAPEIDTTPKEKASD